MRKFRFWAPHAGRRDSSTAGRVAKAPLWAALCFVAGLGSPGSAQAVWPDNGVLDLAVCLDGSDSIAPSDYLLQLSGTTEGFLNVLNPDGIAADPLVRLTVITFSTSTAQQVGPTPIDTLETLTSFNQSVLNLSGSQPENLTDIAECITAATNVLCGGASGCDSPPRQIIDISTDGDPTADNCGGDNFDLVENQSCAALRASQAQTSGVEELNVIGVGDGPTVENMTEWAFPTPVTVFDGTFPTATDDGFVLLVDNFTEYVPAINAKIEAELAMPPTLTLIKSVTNDNGGTAAPSDWSLTATAGSDGGFSVNGSGSSTIAAGVAHTLSESGPNGYTADGFDCTGDVTGDDLTAITLADNQASTCTISNNDIAPTLSLVKTVTNDNGGNNAPSDWTLTATAGTDGGFTVTTGSGSSTVTANASHTLSESGPGGYLADGFDCTGDVTGDDLSAITLDVGQASTCTINNNDLAAGLTLIKAVTNDDGGNAAPSDWSLTATAGTDGGFTVGGSGSGTALANVTYTLSESGPSGYSHNNFSCQGDVNGSNLTSITLAEGESSVCTITNDDDAPTLELRKSVTNDDGGTAAASEWTLIAQGSGGFSMQGTGSNPASTGPQEVIAGVSYSLSESGGPEDYESLGFSCTGDVTGAQSNVTLAAGESAVCTITNDDIVEALRFRVMKDFSDDNPRDVNVEISCNTGTILEQDFDLSEFPPNSVVEFVVTNWTDEPEFFCEITETVPSGYTPSYVANAGDPDPDSCFFVGGSLLEQVNTCNIFNDLDPVDVTVRKRWEFLEDVIGVDDEAFIKLECENVQSGDDKWFWKIDGDEDNVAEVFPDFDGSTTCSVTEKVFSSSVESSGCESPLSVKVGSRGVGCTITNTVFFEGIPTLSQWGMAIMALLMLGIGFVGFRRFV